MNQKYKIRILQPSESLLWDEFIDRSENGTIFHKYDWLKAAENHSKLKLVPLVVYKGEDLVCVFPLFINNKFSLKIILSPPNGCGIPHLGPVISFNTNKRYKIESTYFTLIDELINYIDDCIGYDYIRFVFTPLLNDIRPLQWNGISIKPNYTYIISLKDKVNIIFDGFDGRIRTRVRKAEKNKEIIIHNGMDDEIYKLLSLVQHRYKSQGKKYKITENYIRVLMSSSLGKNIKVLSAYKDSHMLTGNILLEYKENIHHWIGGINPQEKVTGVNELLHWKAIQEYSAKNYKYYELMGANTRHLCDHKSKYNPDILPYFIGEKYSKKGKIAFKLFNKLRN